MKTLKSIVTGIIVALAFVVNAVVMIAAGIANNRDMRRKK